MFQWANKIWKTIQPYERQALLRTTYNKKKKKGFYDAMIAGQALREHDYKRYTPCSLNKVDDELLKKWKKEISSSLYLNEKNIENIIGKEKMYGLEIPQKWNGIGSHEYFHARVLQWLSGVDRKANWIHRIMVPNSLGPAQLLLKFGCEKEFNSEQPFKFMEQIALTTKGNFFERRVVEYQKAKTNNDLQLTDDF